MHSVDQAALDFFKESKFTLTFFRLQTAKRAETTYVGQQAFQLLRHRETLETFDCVIYWGDFICNPAYGAFDFIKWDFKHGLSQNCHESYDKWLELCLGKGRHTHTPKTISFGNSFLTLQQALNRLPSHLQDEIQNLYTDNFDIIIPRDPVSVDLLRSFVPHQCRVEVGLDPAFFLDLGRFSSLHESRRFSYCFRRSKLNKPEQLVRQVAFRNRCLPSKLSRWFKLRADASADRDLMSSLMKIGKSKFTLTDTYHVAVNSINLGTPTFCIGNASNVQNGTLGDFKKKVLFEQLGLSEFYIELSSEMGDNERIDYIHQRINMGLQSPSLSTFNEQLFSLKKIVTKTLRDALLSGS